MTEQQTTATDNALVEKLRDVYRDLTPSAIEHTDLDGMAFTVDEAAERIKSLLAEVERLNKVIDETAAHWLALDVSPPVPFEGGIDGAMLAACTEITSLRADRQRVREALEAILNLETRDVHVGYDHTQSYIYEDYIPLLDVKRIANRALNPASKEANDG